MTLLELVTAGDTWSAAGTGEAPGKGLFVSELEVAVLDGRADFAVHSAKDLPGELAEGLSIMAVPKRADARDVLVGPSGGLDALPPGARVATGSPRREAELRTLRDDLEIVPIRGNVDTRLQHLQDGVADAVILAAAGIDRLGLTPAGLTHLDPATFVPAPGQGCLALEGRTDRRDLAKVLRAIGDRDAERCLRAERALQATLGGGCSAPVGAYCTADEDGLVMRAFMAQSAAGPGITVLGADTGDDPEGLGEDMATALQMRIAALR